MIQVSACSAKVSVVNGGIAPESGSVTDYGMETFDHIVLEDATQKMTTTQEIKLFKKQEQVMMMLQM